MYQLGCEIELESVMDDREHVCMPVSPLVPQTTHHVACSVASDTLSGNSDNPGPLL